MVETRCYKRLEKSAQEAVDSGNRDRIMTELGRCVAYRELRFITKEEMHALHDQLIVYGLEEK